MQEKQQKAKRFWIIGLLISLMGLCAFEYYLSVPRFVVHPDSVAQCDLKNAIMVQEVYFLDHNKYTDSIDKLYVPEKGVTIRIEYANDKRYKMKAFHKKGKHVFYVTNDSKWIYDETGRVYVRLGDRK